MSTFDFSRGRGVLAMTKFVPLRRPGQVTSRPDQSSSNRQEQAPGRQPGSRPAGNNTGANVPITVSAPGLAKYNYKANPNSPLGSPELSLKQCEKLIIHDVHPVQSEHWVYVSNESGAKGYVPITYVHRLEGGLPWLTNKKMEEETEKKEETVPEPAVKPVVKAYRSAYAREAKEAEVAKKYTCELCCKTLNGPIPYRMHMNSKAHLEQEEYEKECG